VPRFYVWTENPRVGGSIPPLATIQQNQSASAFFSHSDERPGNSRVFLLLSESNTCARLDIRTENPVLALHALAGILVFNKLDFVCRGNRVGVP
jgi:hypothetical protein